MMDETWFLEQLEADPLPLVALNEGLRQAAREQKAGDADAMAKLLQDELVRRDRPADALDILQRRVEWLDNDAKARSLLRTDAPGILGPDRRQRELLRHVGLDEAVAPGESARRLRLLFGLQKGALCYDRTWGFGVVRSRDDFERRIEIDFESRPGHFMTYAYASETLELLNEDHLLARCYRDPEGMASCVREDPAQVVRRALQSFGPMPAALLQEQLSPRIVAAADWKRFWDAARKELKIDPRVSLPPRRSEPIELRDQPEDFGDAWIQTLAADCDMESILERVSTWVGQGTGAEASAEGKTVLAERLGFVVRGAVRRPELAARAALLGEACGLPAALFDGPKLAVSLAEPRRLVPATAALSVRDRKSFLEFLHRHLGDALPDTLLSLLPDLDIATFSEAMTILLRAGRDADCADRIRSAIADPEVAPEFLLWLVRNPSYIDAWGPGSAFEWARLLMNALEFEQTGDRLKAQNALRDRIARPETLGKIFDGLTDAQRRELLLRLRDTPAWPQLDRRALVGHMVKRFPELEAVLSGAAASPAAAAQPAASITSLRSYAERRRQLEKLITEEIPKNSREIGVARSYGDLRENHEYKAAKEMQGLLLSRRAEWEQQLQQVRPTDFGDAPTDRAGPGTGVILAWPDGRRETYYLLGLWDQDEALGIVSSEAQLARVLHGHAPGEEVEVPGASGPERAVLAEVLPLPETINAWIRNSELAS